MNGFYTTSARQFKNLSKYYLPSWNTRKWRVSLAIRSSSTDVRRRFVRGYFDADGYPYFHKARNRVVVKVNSVNNRGLKDVRGLLERLGYHPGLYTRYKGRAVWEVTIQRKKEVFRFFDEIGFSIARKQNKLLKMLKQKWPDEFKYK